MGELQTEQLDKFHHKSALDAHEMNNNYFKNYVERNLFSSLKNLDKEINHNLLILDERRLKIYFKHIISILQSSQFLKFEDSKMNHYFNKYNLDKDNVLNINDKEYISLLNHIATRTDLFTSEGAELYQESVKAKNILYRYVAKYEILFFIERVKEMESEHLNIDTNNKSKSKQNQLSANQIVILLDRLGFLAHPDLEDLSRSKQAELISLITGLNKKNFEKYIDKLEASKPTENYQKDINKIDKLLDDLT
ncbi:hypothetical protein DUT90_11955 [Polaribacter sp. WD7]|uniref:hypothetical protein n=1 Tax=Polaribacter sp. WD7 TaxID=2269061 RepID=UPI000DF4202D|nr:hypothetical protein [Polaribacter sp. WD7]RCS26465.1 hypothetical protein DUT90_11955 [Polaribacter sp. WD7]